MKDRNTQDGAASPMQRGSSPTGRRGQLIRVTLTDAEWARVKRIARERDLNASQLVAQVVRESLLKGRS